ncbi:MAG: glycosyltransferase, partial [Coriobacteriia bacterium]|nr:glycosyltransferase [Coriobacteriia bacterium]
MTRKMKVLIIASWYPYPSVPTAGIFIQRQAVALANLCDVAVLHVNVGASANESLPVTEQGITVARSGITSTGLYARYFGYRRAGLMAFAKLVESWGMPDIVHVQALWPAALVARAINQRWGIPYIVTEHSEEYLAQSRRRLVRTPGMLRFLLRPLAQRASATIAVSRYLGDRLVELGLADNVAIIPNALSSCKPASPVVTAPHVIAHVSVMGPAKNLPTLLHAIKDVMARRSDFLLRLVGDGECRGEAEGLAASLGLGDVVEFVGSRSADEVHDLYAQSAFTVVSSTH